MENHDVAKFRISWKGIAVLLALTAAALYYIFTRLVNPSEMIEIISNYPLLFLVLAVLSICLAWMVDALRVLVASRSIGFAISYPVLVAALAASHFLTLVTPFTAGGFPFVIYILYKHGMSIGQAAGIVASSGLAAQLGLIAIVSFVLSLMEEIPPQIISVFSYLKIVVWLYGVVVLILVIITSHGQRFRSWFERFAKYPNIAMWFGAFVSTFRRTFTSHGFYFLFALICGSVYFGLNHTAGFFLLTGFQSVPKLTFANYSMATLLGISPSFTPVPSGAGVSEDFSVYMLDNALPDDMLGTFIILWRTVLFYFPIIIGGCCFAYLFLIWSKSPKRKRE